MIRAIATLTVASLASAAPAFAEPLTPSVDPSTPSTPAEVVSPPDLHAGDLMLAQNPAPAPPGQPGPTVLPNLNAFNPAYLLPQNDSPAAPGTGALAPGLGPDQDDPGTGRIAFLHRLYEMYQAGALKGALLGQAQPDPADVSAPQSPG